jgi:probable rRNA maturation factor
VIAREAREQHKPLRQHFAHLTVHGALHLIGYDHEKPRDAERMEAIERSVLASFRIPDPYA